MTRDFWSGLTAPSENARRVAWGKLQDDLLDEQIGLTPGDLRRLLRLVREEPVAEVKQSGVEALLPVAIFREQSGIDTERSGLARWFWSLFESRAAVYRAIDADRGRDEDAVIELARAVSTREFPESSFIRVPLPDPRWKEQMDFPKTCCFVGRLEIFGREAVREFRSDATRFYFPKNNRPRNLQPGVLDPERYHRIHQRRSGRDIGEPFKSTEDRERRTDYALVQRYFQPERKRTVLLFAGSSALGTLGAVQWAVGLEDQQIPLPEGGLGDRDKFEALLEVSAPHVAHPLQWEPETPRLLRLVVGNELEWYPDRGEWGRPPTDLILIKRNARDQVVGVYANEPTGAQVIRKGVTAQFLEFLYRETKGRAGRTVKRAAAFEDPAWKAFVENATYRSRLQGQLPDAVTISTDPPFVQLNVAIELVN